MSYGFKGTMREKMAQLDALRSDPERPQNITFRQFLAKNYKAGDGSPIEPGHVYSELGIDPSFTRVKDLYGNQDAVHLMPEIVRDGILRGMGASQREQQEAQMQALMDRIISLAPILSEVGGQRFISPEVFLDPVQRGAIQAAFYRDLVMDELMVASPKVTVPRLDVSDAKLVESEEAVTLEEGSVTYGSKDVGLKKKGRAIKISYESIWFNTLNLVSKWFVDVGRKLGSSLNGEAVTTIVDGDQEDGSEAAAIVGVIDVTKGIQYEDITMAWIILSLLGRIPTSLLGNVKMANKYLNLPEVKNKQNTGSVLLPTRVKTPLPTEQDLYPSPKVAESQLAIQDSSMSMVQLTCVPLMVESEKIILKQIAASTATIFTGFCKVQRDASLVIDETLDIEDADYPAWMRPIED